MRSPTRRVSKYAPIPLRVQANFAGRIAAIHMKLGQMVKAGDILIEADTRPEQLALAEQIARQTALTPTDCRSTRRNFGRSRRARATTQSVVRMSRPAMRRRRFARRRRNMSSPSKTETRSEQLQADGIVSEADAQRATANAESKQAAVEALKHSLARLGPEL